MVWVRNDLDAEQLPIESPDMTAALLRLLDRLLNIPCLRAGGYIEGGSGVVRHAAAGHHRDQAKRR